MLIKKTAKTRTLFFIGWDIVLIFLAVYLAFLLRFDFNIPGQYYLALKITIVLALTFHLPIFYFQGLYSFSWSYASTKELVSLAKGSTLAFLLLTLVIYLSRDFPSFRGFPRSTLFISYLLVFLFCGAIRLSKRIYFNIKKNVKKERERILIIGAGDAGEQILRNIQQSQDSHYLPIGFIDDNLFKQGTLIHGIKVLGIIGQIPEIAQENNIEGIVIAFPSAESGVIKKAVQMGRKAGIKDIKILPSLSEVVDGRVSLSDIRDFKMEDLLGRSPILCNQEYIKEFINAKKILITGAAGSIGSELSRQAVKFNPSLVLLLDNNETGIFNIFKELESKVSKDKIIPIVADVQDETKIDSIFSKFKPNIIFHAAAYKHVPLMEAQPEEAVKNNVFGTKTVAECSLKHEAEKFIFISTDKAVKPSSVMGVTKRVGEMICQTLNQQNKTKYISVRFGNVLGSRGSVIPVFKEQIKKGGPVVVTHEDMRRYFMIIPEAVSLVLEASKMGLGGEVFVLDMGDPVKIFDLAKELIRLSGLEPDKDIPIVFDKPRPGEKFFEEILTAEEGTVATENKNIFTAKLSTVDKAILENALLRLKSAGQGADGQKIKSVLAEIVASYSYRID